jgi:hypothetical protein
VNLAALKLSGCLSAIVLAAALTVLAVLDAHFEAISVSISCGKAILVHKGQWEHDISAPIPVGLPAVAPNAAGRFPLCATSRV